MITRGPKSLQRLRVLEAYFSHNHPRRCFLSADSTSPLGDSGPETPSILWLFHPLELGQSQQLRQNREMRVCPFLMMRQQLELRKYHSWKPQFLARWYPIDSCPSIICKKLKQTLVFFSILKLPSHYNKKSKWMLALWMVLG